MKLFNFKFLTLVLPMAALFAACTSETPDDPNDQYDDLYENIYVTAEELTKKLETQQCNRWSVETESLYDHEWLSLKEFSGEGNFNTELIFKPNTTGEDRSEVINFKLEHEGNEGNRVTVTYQITVTQSSKTKDGVLFDFNLPFRFLEKRNFILFSPESGIENLEITIDNKTLKNKPLDKRNFEYDGSGLTKGRYPIKIKYSDKEYNFGTCEVYSFNEEDIIPAPTIPDKFNPLNVEIEGIINTGYNNESTIVLSSNGEHSHPYFIDNEGRIMTATMEYIVRLNSRYLVFNIHTTSPNDRYDPVGLHVHFDKSNFHSIFLNTETNQCFVVPEQMYLDTEYIRWAGNIDKEKFISLTKGKLYEINIKFDTEISVEEKHEVSHFYDFSACGDMIALGKDDMIVGNILKPVTPPSYDGTTYNYDYGAARISQSHIPVYVEGYHNIYRVVNYSQFSKNGTHYMHDLIVESIDGNSTLFQENWYNNSATHRYFEIFSREDLTYFRPYSNGTTESRKAYTLDKNGATYTEVNCKYKGKEVYAKSTPYYGDFYYFKENGKICRAKIDDYSGNYTELEASERSTVNLGPSGLISLELIENGIVVKCFNNHSDKAKIYDLPNQYSHGWMIRY